MSSSCILQSGHKCERSVPSPAHDEESTATGTSEKSSSGNGTVGSFFRESPSAAPSADIIRRITRSSSVNSTCLLNTESSSEVPPKPPGGAFSFFNTSTSRFNAATSLDNDDISERSNARQSSFTVRAFTTESASWNLSVSSELARVVSTAPRTVRRDANDRPPLGFANAEELGDDEVFAVDLVDNACPEFLDTAEVACTAARLRARVVTLGPRANAVVAAMGRASVSIPTSQPNTEPGHASLTVRRPEGQGPPGLVVIGSPNRLIAKIGKHFRSKTAIKNVFCHFIHNIPIKIIDRQNLSPCFACLPRRAARAPRILPRRAARRVVTHRNRAVFSFGTVSFQLRRMHASSVRLYGRYPSLRSIRRRKLRTSFQ